MLDAELAADDITFFFCSCPALVGLRGWICFGRGVGRGIRRGRWRRGGGPVFLFGLLLRGGHCGIFLFAAEDFAEEALKGGADAPSDGWVQQCVQASVAGQQFLWGEVFAMDVLFEFELEFFCLGGAFDDVRLNEFPPQFACRECAAVSGNELVFAGEGDGVELAVQAHAFHQGFEIADFCSYPILDDDILDKHLHNRSFFLWLVCLLAILDARCKCEAFEGILQVVYEIG